MAKVGSRTMTQVQKPTNAEHRPMARIASESAPLTPGQQLTASLRELLAVALDRAAGFVAEKVDQVAQSLENVAVEGGPKIGAILGGVEAKLAGANPVWGAVKGTFGSLSPAARVGILLLLILAVVLLPITLVLVLLGLIVLAVILMATARWPR